MRQADGSIDPDAVAALGAGIVTDDPLGVLASDAFSKHSGLIGVAVSGGSDSMAVLRLLAAHHPVAAVTVDHGLRPESAVEAGFVAQTCASLGISHEILQWSGPSPQGNLMDQARRARFSLIGAWARARGIDHIALGHTSDDQAETFLMRLARESGLEGLAGMRPRFAADGVTWHRPFLGVSRERLRDHLRAIDQTWCDDPSNENQKYDRVKARKALKLLVPLGISAQGLSYVVQHLAAAEATLQSVLAQQVADHVTTPSGDVVIAAPAFAQMPAEMQRRLMNAALLWVSGADYAPRAAKIATFLAQWRDRSDVTLHGCRIHASPTEIRITREENAVATLRARPDQRWDRWELIPTSPDYIAPKGSFIGALGEAGLKFCPDWRATCLPRRSLLASPALWDGENLLCAPVAGLENGWKARIACGALSESLFRR